MDKAKLPTIYEDRGPSVDAALDSIFGPVQTTDPADLLDLSLGGTGGELADQAISAWVSKLDTFGDISNAYLNSRATLSATPADFVWGEWLRMGADSARPVQIDKAITRASQTSDVDGGVKKAQEMIDSRQEPPVSDFIRQAIDEYDKGDEWVRAEVRRDVMMSMIAVKLQEMGYIGPDGEPKTWEQVKAFGGRMIPGRNIADFTSALELKGPFKGWEQYKNAIMGFQQEGDFGTQITEFQKILDWLQKGTNIGTDNPMLFMERAGAFINPYDAKDVKASLLWDALDVALSVPTSRVSKFANLIRESRRPARLLKTAGAKLEAGKLQAAAVSDARTAAAMGTNPLDAAVSASPISGEHLAPEWVAGFAAETQDALVQLYQKRQGVLQSMRAGNAGDVRVGDIPAADFEQWITELPKKYAGKARVVERRPTDNAAVIEVDIVELDPAPGKGAQLSRMIAERLDLQEDLRSTLRMTDEGGQAAEQIVTDLELRIQKLDAEIEPVLQGLKAERDALKAEVDDLLKMSDDGAPIDIDPQLARLTILDETLKDPTKASILDPTGPIYRPGVRRETVFITRDDIGQLESLEFKKAFWRTESPAVRIGQVLPGATSDLRARDLQSAIMNERYQNLMKDLGKGLSSKEVDDVNAILLQGDKDKVNRYSADELVSTGIKTPDGLKKLTTVETVNAYHAARDMFDDLYVQYGQNLGRKLRAEGYKQVHLPDGAAGFIRPDTEMTRKPKLYYIASEGRFGSLDKDALKKATDEGAKFYRLKFEADAGKAGEVNAVLAKPSDWIEVVDNPLPKRPGYVTKIIKDTNYIGRKWVGRTINGEKLKEGDPRGWQVVQFFDNPVARENWKLAETAKGNKVKTNLISDYIREGNNLQDLEMKTFGGPISGKRTDIPIGFNGTGQEGQRMSAFEALENYMTHVSAHVPTDIYKAMLAEKFHKAIKAWEVKNPGQQVLKDPTDWKSDIVLPASQADYKYFRSFQDWLVDQMRIPTAEMRAWETLTSNMADWVMHKPGGKSKVGQKLTKALVSAHNKDITASLRGLAFHTTLGWWNPVQLMVQAFGASVMFAMHPLKAPRLMAEYMAMRALYLNPTDEIAEITADAMRRAGGNVDAKSLKQAAMDYRRSGLHQNVRSTADYTGTLVPGSGSFQMVRDLANQGLYFYREGERFVRGMGWLMAREDYIAKTGKAALSNEDIHQITMMSNKYTFNLDRANRAWWQRGILSVPTQFWQVSKKFQEHMFYQMGNMDGSWTATEKIKVGLLFPMYFGAAGVPFGTWAFGNIRSWLTNDETGGAGLKDSALVETVSQGVVGMLANWILGSDTEISSRVAMTQNISDTISRLVAEENSFYKILMGVSGEFPSRVLQAVSNILAIATPLDLDTVDSGQVEEVVYELAAITSTGRNSYKSAIVLVTGDLYAGKIYKSNVAKHYSEAERFRIGLIQALGLTTRDGAQYWRKEKYIKLTDKDTKDALDSLKELARRQKMNYYQGESGRRRVMILRELILAPLTPEQRVKTQKAFGKWLQDMDASQREQILRLKDAVIENEGDLAKGGPTEGGSLALDDLSQ